MGDYTINGKGLSEFGITAIRSTGTSIAISGAWDLPKRKGNTSYNWREEDNVEAFVDTDDMLFEGRTLSLSGIITNKDNQSITQLISEFKTYINSLSGEIFTLSSQWGTWYVQLSSDMKITRYNNVARIDMTFSEPLPDISGTLPQPSGTGSDIDGYSWSEFGIQIYNVSGAENITSRKEIGITTSQNDNTKIYGGKAASKITLSGVIIADNYKDFKTKIKALYALFAGQGLRLYKYKKETYKCFAPEGFTISGIIISYKISALWNITLTTASND